ncbi:Sister chromatid cohesion 1 protein 1, partial [Nosema granulosis]
MQSRTNLSLLFFVSTTYRISKKNLQRLSIPSLLEDLANPPQPLALRLYSSLVVGVVKVYILKMKNYEIEIQSLLVAIGSSRSKCRSKCSRSKKKLDVEDFHLLEESLPENCNALEGNCNSLENDVDDLLENSLDILNIKRIKMISIVDSQTEYTNISKFCLQNLTKSKYANYAKINYYANYAKINYYANYAKINYYAKYKIFS